MSSGEFPDAGDKYELLRPLGRGGMGEVYLARDRRLQREVAIKYLRGDLPAGNWRQRLETEAQLLARLNHANIVQIYDIIGEEDAPALVMEYVQGRNLFIHLREQRAELADKLRWLSEIAAGLAASHDAGVAHCDLKAENVLINAEGTAKVTDFGIASHSGDAAGDVAALGALAELLLQEHRQQLSPSVKQLLAKLSAKGKTTARQAAEEFRLAWHEQSQTETPLPQDLARQQRRPWAIILFLLLALGALAWWLKPSPPSLRVAVMPPDIGQTGQLTERQLQLLSTTVQQSLQEKIITSPLLVLVSQREVREAGGNTADLLAALGADALLHSSLECAGGACDLVIERLNAPDGDVFTRRTVALLADTPLDTAEAIHRQWPFLLPEGKDEAATSGMIAEADYASYIEVTLARQQAASPSPEILRQAADLLPRARGFAPLYLLYAELSFDVYEELGDPAYLDDLETVLSAAEQTLADSLFVLRSRFQLALYRQDFDGAEQILQSLGSGRTDEPLIAYLRGSLLDAQFDYAGATSYYHRAATLQPSMQNRYAQARNLYWAGETSAALDVLNSLLQRYPATVKALNLRAIIRIESGDIESGIADMKNSLEIQPNPLLRANLGSAYLLLHDYESARQQLQIAYDDDSRDSVLVLNLADAEQQLGNGARSSALYTSIIERYQRGDTSVLPIVAAQAYAQMGQFTKALGIVNDLQEEETGAAINASTAALIYALAGQNLMALVEMDKALQAGLSAVWFGMVWYDSLCTEQRFRERMAASGYPDRCEPPGD